MLEKSIGLLFFLKQPKNQKKSTLRMVYLRITVNGESKELSTKREWDPSRWNQKAGRATTNREDARTLNVHLDALTTRNLLERNLEITAEAIKKILLGETDENRMVLKIFEEHNRKMASLDRQGCNAFPIIMSVSSSSFWSG